MIIYPDEWDKIARFLDVKVEDIKEETLDEASKYERLETENKALKQKIDLLKKQLDVLNAILK